MICLKASFFLLTTLRTVYYLAKIINNDELCKTTMFFLKNIK